MTVLCTNWDIEFRFLGEASDFCLLCNIQASSKTHYALIQRCFFVSPYNISWRHGRGLWRYSLLCPNLGIR